MTENEYIAKQKKAVAEAMISGKRLLDISARLHRTCDSADSSPEKNDSDRNYLQDSFSYFSFSDAAAEISGMPEELTDFKRQLIGIKKANDDMLLEGGFRRDIDTEITRVFLTHKLCKFTIIDERILAAVKDAVETLEGLEKSLSE